LVSTGSNPTHHRKPPDLHPTAPHSRSRDRNGQPALIIRQHSSSNIRTPVTLPSRPHRGRRAVAHPSPPHPLASPINATNCGDHFRSTPSRPRRAISGGSRRAGWFAWRCNPASPLTASIDATTRNPNRQNPARRSKEDSQAKSSSVEAEGDGVKPFGWGCPATVAAEPSALIGPAACQAAAGPPPLPHQPQQGHWHRLLSPCPWRSQATGDPLRPASR